MDNRPNLLTKAINEYTQYHIKSIFGQYNTTPKLDKLLYTDIEECVNMERLTPVIEENQELKKQISIQSKLIKEYQATIEDLRLENEQQNMKSILWIARTCRLRELTDSVLISTF